MNSKRLITFICIIAMVCVLTGCGGGAAPAISDATESTPTRATEPPTEPPTESEPEPEPEPEPVYNRYDTFIDGEITLNNTDYTIADGRKRMMIRLMNRGYYRYYDTAFYVIDLATGMSIGYQADDYFSPACTRKAGLALSWYMQLEENRIKNEQGVPLAPGEKRWLLTDTYYYDGTDYMEGAGIIARSGYGTYTIQDLLHYMLFMSDNTAYKALWRLMGIEKYTALEDELGIPEYEEPSRRDKLWTPMRAHDIGLIWQRIWEYKQTGSPEAELFWYEVTHNELCEIGKVVQSADEIAHKSGSDDYGFHEAGIVVRGENAYVIVTMSKVPLPIANDDYDCIHRMIKEIDAIMKEYYVKTINR